MHLKSLTLRGFKSFASSTTLRFEPGITAVVGPNGSGKSNVVDALAWVMGEQGAKSLRGGKMEDVIFAGTAGRPPLGRAEVLLTIDNSDGALPIDYSEVTISRIMFRNGGSEYAINGETCRLLDVQELLSDSGIGREMHVIVGQGQLDAVLSATPEDRRGFIEEAAGVLKHRKRKEKALRKLDAMTANLTRLSDLTSELRRQLKPLGRQAEVARRATVVQADVRDARLRLLADDYVTLRSTLEAEVADETVLRARRSEVEAAHAAAVERETQIDALTASDAPKLAAAQDTWYRLSALRERLRGTASLAAERVRHLQPDETMESTPGRDPAELEREAREVREHEGELQDSVERDRAALADVEAKRREAEEGLAAAERALAAHLRAAADRREGLARLTGQVQSARTRLETRETEIARLRTSISDARARAEHQQREFSALESQVAGLDQGELDLDSEHERAATAFQAADEQVEQLRAAERDAERERAALAARKEALEIGLSGQDGMSTLLAAGTRLSGVLGSVAALVSVRSGYERAVGAALGSAAEAIAVDSMQSAFDAMALLKESESGRASILIAAPGASAGSQRSPLPGGATWAADVVDVRSDLRPRIEELLALHVVVDDLARARDIVRGDPSLIAVTRDGDVLSSHLAAGGSGREQGLIEVQAAVDETTRALETAVHDSERLRFELATAIDVRRDAQSAVDASMAALHESDARMAAVAEQLATLGSQARAATAEAHRLEAALAQAEGAAANDRVQVEELGQRLSAAEQAPDDVEPDSGERDTAARIAVEARAAEVDARLTVRTGEERLSALTDRAAGLEHAAREERDARLRAEARRERRAREAVVAVAVLEAAEKTLTFLDSSLQLAVTQRDTLQHQRDEREGELLAVRARTRDLAAELDSLTTTVHRDEVARAEQRLRLEALETRSIEEFGVEPTALINEYGPEQMVPPSPPVPGEEPTADAPAPKPIPYVREHQEKRLRTAERALALLGKVNPLALEEYAALEERLTFLTEQLEDLKRTKRDLLDIIREVDEKVEAVFTEAYHDTAREFEGVFARLFPGGEGRLVLTDPSDMLNTGIDVEARPPGKKVKRLSLLSGGERSLTAIALLVAIFKARPSPFYVLDEVEAALDDVNLGRLLTILDELRAASQLIVVTHHKRTMEIADALYGVSMRGDGVTTVISQRLREAESA